MNKTSNEQEPYRTNMRLLSRINPELARKIETSTESDSVYGEPRTAKTGEAVSCFTNGQAMFSLYNPKREAEQFYNGEKSLFFTVSGMGSAQHIYELLKNPRAAVCAIEKNAASVKTLFSQFDFSHLLQNKNFFLTIESDVYAFLCARYIPQIFGNFTYIPQRAWRDCNEQSENAIASSVKEALKTVSADYSVQAHFGKVWMRNILQNAALIPFSGYPFKFPLHKKAAVIAAGPSLDKSITRLMRQKDDLYIIATDTASLILQRYGIASDVVVSIDGQNISYRHFSEPLLSKNTLFVLDLCAHPAIAKKAHKNGNPFFFFNGNHPLCTALNAYTAHKSGEAMLPLLDTKSGTVTVTAVDFARKAGFTTIELYGADFSYTHGKPYAKGSYLDTTFALDATRLSPAETAFTKLMYRTEVTRTDESTVTTSILTQYKNYLYEYLSSQTEYCSFYNVAENDAVPLFTKKQNNDTISDTVFLPKKLQNSFNYADFIVWLFNQIENAKTDETNPIRQAFLPFAAWCEKNTAYKTATDSFNVILDLVTNYINRFSGVQYEK